MSEAALLDLIDRYPHPVAIARRVEASTMQLGVRRLLAGGLLTRRGGGYRVTERGRNALQFERALKLAVARALA